MPKTSAQKARDLANRQRAAGKTQRKVWAHPDDWPAIMRVVKEMDDRRSREQR